MLRSFYESSLMSLHQTVPVGRENPMKRKIQYDIYKKTVEREINYIPVRYVLAILVTVLEITSIIGIVIVLCRFVPYFYLAAWITEIGCVIRIISSDDNPDYKVPWLLVVLILPIAGFMLYFLFSSRTLNKKQIKRLQKLDRATQYPYDDTEAFLHLHAQAPEASTQARLLCKLANTYLFEHTDQRYFPSGEEMFHSLLPDLRSAERFIYLEYFIIEDGEFWGAVLDILKEKAASGVHVKVLYDDIGCMSTLPGNYAKELAKHGIDAHPFARLRGNADSEFNNRSHRKLLIIDGKIGYTGGINIADEYINRTARFGHWKDTALRLEGAAVCEMTRLFLTDFGMHAKAPFQRDFDLFPKHSMQAAGFLVPFGDGPRPLYQRRVAKSLLMDMFNRALYEVAITTPYLIPDNELCSAIENAALRGVRVKIIVPHIPDKKLVFSITQSFYKRLCDAGVEIYEYTPGFIHAKSYLIDQTIGMIGTVNLDHRSLVHHFENGIWMYRCHILSDMHRDFEETLKSSKRILPNEKKIGIYRRFFRSVVRIFAPLM